jgi:tetratricopeptide (TPR) repeat protein
MDRLLQQAEDSLRAGDRARAEALCGELLARAPGHADALRMLGILWLERGRAAEAVPLLREASRAEPGNLNALDALAAAFAAVGDFAQAEETVRRGLAVDASRPVAHLRLGMMLTRQGRWSEATRAFEDAIERAPRFAEAHHNLGDALTKLHRPEKAISCFRRALAIDPENPETHNSLGFALQGLGLWGAATRRYARALALDPAFAKAHYNLALAGLFNGDFARGWPAYEQRLRCEPVRATLRKRADTLDLYERLPRWQGPSEAGAGEVAIWAEQGIGDQILFSTLIPELIGAKVPFVYEVDRRLLPAYERAFPDGRFVALDDPPRAALQQAGRVLLAGSLPGLFRRAREDFARQPAKLLSALPERVAHYRQRLAVPGQRLNVALSWRSTREDWFVQKKSVPLVDFSPLLKLPGVRFVDVQYGDTAAERSAAEVSTGVQVLRFDDVDHFNDLEEVLAILEACDLLITTSNATAHFAGALGKHTWLLYPANQPPFHYWSRDGNDRALWYPAVEILTGVWHAEWKSLIEFAAARLGARALDGATESASDAPGTVSATPSGADALDGVRMMRAEGRLTEAVAACRRMLEGAPRDADAWCELSQALRRQDKLDEARGAVARAIELAPGLAAAWFNLGAIQIAQGEAARGIESYRQALALDPRFAEAWSNLGGALGAEGDKPGEIEAYRRAVGINPRLAPVWSNLGGALLEAGEIGEALLACGRATELDPDYAAGWSNLGNALRVCGEHEEAVAACETALKLAPKLAEAWSTLGAALHALGRVDEAVHAYRSAAGIQPGEAHHHFNLGVTLRHCGHNAEAIGALRRALALDPGHAQAHWDLGFTLLASGNFPEGWEEYEWRWRRHNAEARRYDFTPWDGDASTSRRLLLWAEQGIGDHILYGSLLTDLVSSPLHITLEVDPRLASLYQRSFPQIAVIPQRDPPADPRAYDCQAPLGSLGRWLRPSFESFPRHEGYLKPDARRAEAYRARFPGDAAIRVVGVSWKSANQEFGSSKSQSLPDWQEVLRVPHAHFVDLQYGDTESEREEVERRTGARIDHLPDLDLYDDLEGLAALCAACDLVITASNVTAHMAGALGRPVWLMVPKGGGRLWYWFSGRSDSPWYPSMRIFEQAAAGSWREVLNDVARELVPFQLSLAKLRGPNDA